MPQSAMTQLNRQVFNVLKCFYLRQVCRPVCRITQKLFNRFSQKTVERWHMGNGRTR